jgi:ABC-type branched-subunit amino acid transport system ATPase component
MSTGLAIDDVTVRFGGLIAVNGVTLAAPPGRITGLIGPNGAGKTTTFNVCSGLQRPTSGQVAFDGQDVTTASPSVRARYGLGRTFQRMQLFDSLTVAQNVAIGREAGLAGANPVRLLLSAPGDAGQVSDAAEAAIELCGLGRIAGRRAGSLSTGERRLVELARVLAGRFTLLLLDEPSSGLDRVETARFGDILTRTVSERGTGILLVEHDMALVLSVCDYIYVLEFGTLIFEGTPDDIRSSDVVRQAYLGQTAGSEVA